MSESKSSGSSATGLFIGIASLGAGAVHGYYDSQGWAFEGQNTEYALTWGPTIVQGTIGALIGGIVGLAGGGITGLRSTRYRSSSLEKLATGTGGAVLGGTFGAGVGGLVGGLKGGIQTLVGYGLGYFAGYLTR